MTYIEKPAATLVELNQVLELGLTDTELSVLSKVESVTLKGSKLSLVYFDESNLDITFELDDSSGNQRNMIRRIVNVEETCQPGMNKLVMLDYGAQSFSLFGKPVSVLYSGLVQSNNSSEFVHISELISQLILEPYV